MATYTVRPNQNIFDVALRLYGSIEGLFDLLITNSWLNMATDLQTGMELEYHEDFVVNSSIVATMEEDGLVPANGERRIYYKDVSLPLMFIVPMGNDILNTALTVGGEGVMHVDWGDNSELERITLSHAAQRIDHYFDNTVGERQMRVYGNFSLTLFDTTELDGDLLLIRPLAVDEYVNQGNGYTLAGLSLLEGTYKVDLQGCTISDLLPIGDMNLQELNLLHVKFTNVSVLDDYLEYIVANYGSRRDCTVYLDTQPTERGMEAINTIINEAEWNASGKWKFIINDTIYTAQ